MSRNYVQEATDALGHQYAYNFDGIMHKYMMRTFGPFLPQGKALELGCYKGEFTEIIKKHYKDLTVIEAAENLIIATRERVGQDIKFIHSTFERVNLEGVYDAIFLIHTLEHLDDRVGVLKKIDSWLSPKGRLFLAVPNANAPSRQIAVKMGLISHNEAVTEAESQHGHRITYTLDTLEKEVTDAGLAIIQRGGIFFKPFANFQFDKLMKTDIISADYLEGCYQLGMQYPDLCASIYLVCDRKNIS